MAVNEPDGIVAVWNLHLLERPEFVFHAQVSPLNYLLAAFRPFHFPLTLHPFSTLLCSVRRSLSLLLPISSQSRDRRNLLRPDSAVGYSFTVTKSRSQDSPFGIRSHSSGLLPRNGWHSKRSFPHFRLDRWNRLRLDARHARKTSRVSRITPSSSYEN